MSSYVFGMSLSYQDYLVGKGFVSDITSASRDASRRVSMDISRQTWEVIASNEALARDSIRTMEASSDRVDGTLNEGFDRLSYGIDQLSRGLDNISEGISDLNATFHWGFSEMLG